VREVVSFYREVGLPTDLSDLNIVQIDECTILKVAEWSCAEDDTMGNMPFEVEPEMVKDAILATDNADILEVRIWKRLPRGTEKRYPV
jgi:glycerol dehydrogenase